MEFIEDIHSFLQNFFDVLVVEDTKTTISTTIKVGNKFEVVTKTYVLKTIDLKNINEVILNEIRNIDIESIKISSNNIIGRFFGVKDYYKLYKEIPSDCFIVTSSKNYGFLKKLSNNIYINELLNDKIIIGNKPKLVIKIGSDIEYYLDKSNIKVIELK